MFHINMLDVLSSRLDGLPLNAGLYSLFSALGGETLGLGGHLVDVADHVEGDLGQVIVLASQDVLESGDGLVNGDQLAGVVGENLSDLEKQTKYFTALKTK